MISWTCSISIKESKGSCQTNAMNLYGQGRDLVSGDDCPIIGGGFLIILASKAFLSSRYFCLTFSSSLRIAKKRDPSRLAGVGDE